MVGTVGTLHTSYQILLQHQVNHGSTQVANMNTLESTHDNAWRSTLDIVPRSTIDKLKILNVYQLYVYGGV